MTVLVGPTTRVVVQGATGREGSFHLQRMMEYGTKIVAGVTPGKGGASVHGVPVYDTVEEAVRRHGANASVIFVPARAAAEAVLEAVDAGVELVVVITEHIPVHDALRAINYARSRGVTVIGPNCPGVVAPPVRTKLGIMPNSIYQTPGKVAVVSRSGTLTYEISYQLVRAGFGINIAVGVGGDPVVGLDLMEATLKVAEDPDVRGIVVIGEVGGDAEERLAKLYAEGAINKPVVAYIAGRTAPPGKRMGHAGAIVMMGSGDARGKIEAFKAAGVPVAETPFEVPKLLSKLLK
ncbi:succinate--CoA ligase subunit alpha [Pyrobaculum neutrophilum]|uniref:Succinate--CoA ligase [ADP-forming] subunit alpha n=1 Tax=Pyrobaculum neutrophilum (strain DSM 2338 / JCM 9278 / NBRC 100436 / V24Sta) TaxID=444157 RepID=B1Y9G0_PYRNV|nr:succinate--CoA ligase subunit alpha [Pyrobaculum neutrophilum]ACB40389.1 succinyl-CoA synthetase, alpha subunit [Pyrobaculum neutrophilum V24Sta]